MLELDRRTADQVSSIETQFEDRLDAMAAEITELQERQSNVLQDVKRELENGTQSLSQKMDELTVSMDREGEGFLATFEIAMTAL